jgi:hypothetical protein
MRFLRLMLLGAIVLSGLVYLATKAPPLAVCLVVSWSAERIFAAWKE